jgi:hypothetical protein
MIRLPGAKTPTLPAQRVRLRCAADADHVEVAIPHVLAVLEGWIRDGHGSTEDVRRLAAAWQASGRSLGALL